MRQELAPRVALKPRFDFTIKQLIQTGDIGLMHTEWKVSGPQQIAVYAIEVARRQPDGKWCWLIGDPLYCRQGGWLVKRWAECGSNTLLVAFEVATSIDIERINSNHENNHERA